MADVGKHFVLHRQKRTSGIHEVNAGQVVFMSHCLCPNVLFDRHGVVRTAFNGGIVGHEQALTAVNHADTRDDSC